MVAPRARELAEVQGSRIQAPDLGKRLAVSGIVSPAQDLPIQPTRSDDENAAHSHSFHSRQMTPHDIWRSRGDTPYPEMEAEFADAKRHVRTVRAPEGQAGRDIR